MKYSKKEEGELTLLGDPRINIYNSEINIHNYPLGGEWAEHVLRTSTAVDRITGKLLQREELEKNEYGNGVYDFVKGYNLIPTTITHTFNEEEGFRTLVSFHENRDALAKKYATLINAIMGNLAYDETITDSQLIDKSPHQIRLDMNGEYVTTPVMTILEINEDKDQKTKLLYDMLDLPMSTRFTPFSLEDVKPTEQENTDPEFEAEARRGLKLYNQPTPTTQKLGKIPMPLTTDEAATKFQKAYGKIRIGEDSMAVETTPMQATSTKVKSSKEEWISPTIRWMREDVEKGTSFARVAQLAKDPRIISPTKPTTRHVKAVYPEKTKDVFLYQGKQDEYITNEENIQEVSTNLAKQYKEQTGKDVDPDTIAGQLRDYQPAHTTLGTDLTKQPTKQLDSYGRMVMAQRANRIITMKKPDKGEIRKLIQRYRQGEILDFEHEKEKKKKKKRGQKLT